MATKRAASKTAAKQTEIVTHAGRVIVSVSGSPSSVGALLWVMKQGVVDPIVVFERRTCHPKVTESYVRAIAGIFHLRVETALERAVRGTKLPLVVVVGARYGDPIRDDHDGKQFILRPLVGKSEEEILAELDSLHVRPHPAITLGISEVCTDEELAEAARRAARLAVPSLEIAIATACVETGFFPPDAAMFQPGQHREQLQLGAAPLTEEPVPQIDEEDFEGEPVAEPEIARPLGPDLGLETLRANGYPTPPAWEQAGEAFREKGKVWLFSYGSNSPEQLAERLGHKVQSVPARAFGRERTYVGHSARWKGATATLVPERGGSVDGGAVLVSEADLKALDGFEGVPKKYQRQTVEIVLQPFTKDARKVTAIAYLAAPGNQKLGVPSRAYLEAVAKNLNANRHDKKKPPERDMRDIEPFAFDEKGEPQILYPSGVTPEQKGDGENQAEIWLRLSPSAQRAKLAWASKAIPKSPKTVAEQEALLEKVFGTKRWNAYKAKFAKYAP